MTRRVQTNFRASDFTSLGSKNDKPSASSNEGDKPVAKKAAAEPRKTSESDPNKVPEGTSQEVLDWVGSDPSRAKKALSAEKKSDDPRSSVTEPLERIVEEDKAAKKRAAAEKKAAAAEKQGQ